MNKNNSNAQKPVSINLPAERNNNQSQGSNKLAKNNLKDFEINAGTGMFEDLRNETDMRINREIEDLLGDDLMDDGDSFSERNLNPMNALQENCFLSNDKKTTSKKNYYENYEEDNGFLEKIMETYGNEQQPNNDYTYGMSPNNKKLSELKLNLRNQNSQEKMKDVLEKQATKEDPSHFK